MAPHSSILAWKIQWTEEPSRLQSMGLQRVGHNFNSNGVNKLVLMFVMTGIKINMSIQLPKFFLTHCYFFHFPYFFLSGQIQTPALDFKLNCFLILCITGISC